MITAKQLLISVLFALTAMVAGYLIHELIR